MSGKRFMPTAGEAAGGAIEAWSSSFYSPFCAGKPVAAENAGAVTRLSGDQCVEANAARRYRRMTGAGTG